MFNIKGKTRKKKQQQQQQNSLLKRCEHEGSQGNVIFSKIGFIHKFIATAIRLYNIKAPYDHNNNKDRTHKSCGKSNQHGAHDPSKGQKQLPIVISIHPL